MNDVQYLHALNLFPTFGPKRLALLGNYFESFAAAWHAPITDLLTAGIDSAVAEKFAAFRTGIDVEHSAAELSHLDIRAISYKDPYYPTLLLEIPTPPAILYYRGTLPASDALLIAAVGTRKITTYGRSVVPNIIGPLVDAGVIIVSGMAYGVDAAVHTEVVHRAKPTIAVLGSGLDDVSLYPKQHALLAQEIIDAGGCLLGEYPPGTPGYKQNFVARNRIIAGLCVGTIIIECDLKSGSLITANYALEQNRRVYAVPGPIYSLESRGPNNLIKMGAQLVTESSDILQDLHIAPNTSANIPPPANPTESAILDILSGKPLLTDDLIKQSGLEAATVTSALTFLEMKGRVKNVGANQYIRIR